MYDIVKILKDDLKERKKNICGIYGYLDLEKIDDNVVTITDALIYIGQSINCRQRNNGHHDKRKDQQQIDTVLVKNPDRYLFYIIEECLPDELDNKERTLINLFNPLHNLQDGGTNVRGINNPMYGRKHKESTRKKISQKQSSIPMYKRNNFDSDNNTEFLEIRRSKSSKVKSGYVYIYKENNKKLKSSVNFNKVVRWAKINNKQLTPLPKEFLIPSNSEIKKRNKNRSIGLKKSNKFKKSTQGRNNSNFNSKYDTFYNEIRKNITNGKTLFLYREDGVVKCKLTSFWDVVNWANNNNKPLTKNIHFKGSLDDYEDPWKYRNKHASKLKKEADTLYKEIRHVMHKDKDIFIYYKDGSYYNKNIKITSNSFEKVINYAKKNNLSLTLNECFDYNKCNKPYYIR